MLLLGQTHGSPIPHHLGHLHDALCALAPPDYQRSHEQCDRNGEHNERAEDAVGRVPQGPAGDGALAEVATVDSKEEFVHFRIGPETASLVCHELGAASELPIAPYGLSPVTPQSLPNGLHVLFEAAEAQLLDESTIVRVLAGSDHEEMMSQQQPEAAPREAPQAGGHGKQSPAVPAPF